MVAACLRSASCQPRSTASLASVYRLAETLMRTSSSHRSHSPSAFSESHTCVGSVSSASL